MASKEVCQFLLFLLGPLASCFADHKSFYGGVFEGSCGQNGIYYKDTKGFMICSNNYSYYMRCAAGTRNPPESDFVAGNYYSNSDFCGIIVDIFGTSRDDFLRNSENEQTHGQSIVVGSNGQENIYHKVKARASATDVETSSESPNVQFRQAEPPRRRKLKKRPRKKGHHIHKKVSTQTQESPESYLRKVLEVSKLARSKQNSQNHESSFETTVSKHTEVSSKSGRPDHGPGYHGSIVHQSITEQKGHPNVGVTGSESIAKSVETGLKETMSKIFKESKGPMQSEDERNKKVVRSSTTHTYHHPGGIVQTFEQTMHNSPNAGTQVNSGLSPVIGAKPVIDAPAPIPEPPVIHFPAGTTYQFPGMHENHLTANVHVPAHNQNAPGLNPYVPNVSNVNGIGPGAGQYVNHFQPYSRNVNKAHEVAMQHLSGHHQNYMSNGLHPQNVFHPPVPNVSLPQVPTIEPPSAPKPFDANNYHDADVYGQTAEDFKQTFPYLPGAFNPPQSNHQHHTYQSTVTESYSINIDGKPEVTQTTTIVDSNPSHVHINTPYPFPESPLNFNQNHLDFAKYSSQFGYRPYYGIHPNPNAAGNIHRQVLPQHPAYQPIEGRQAPLAPPIPPVHPQNGHQERDGGFSFKQESYSENNSHTDSEAPGVPAHGTKTFLTQKSEYMNVNGKTLKDYTSTVYGVHAV